MKDKRYCFTWLATSSKLNKVKAGRVSVYDYCHSSAEAHAKRRVKVEKGLHDYHIDLSLERVEK